MQRVAVRTLAIGVVVMLLVLGGSAARDAFHERSGEVRDNSAQAAELPDAPEASAENAEAQTQTEAKAAPPIVPVLRPGATELGEGFRAVRHGNVVTVQFDAPLLRTRRAEKFERWVRALLPRLYGPVADTLLAGVPVGELTAAGDLLADLPERGIHLPAIGDPVLTLWPETRPGSEGPLVIAFRVEPRR